MNTQVRMGFYIVGGVLAAFGAYKAYVDGFYPSEVPMVFGVLIAGGICLYIASKIKVPAEDEV